MPLPIALKKFVVSSNCETGPKEILINGKAGALFKVKSYLDLSNKILFFHKNKKIRDKKVQFGYSKINVWNPKIDFGLLKIDHGVPKIDFGDPHHRLWGLQNCFGGSKNQFLGHDPNH